MIDLERQNCVYVSTRLQILNYKKSFQESGNKLYLFEVADRNNSLFYSFSDGKNAYIGIRKNDILDTIDVPEIFYGTDESLSRVVLNSDNALDCIFNLLRDRISEDIIQIRSITKNRKLKSLIILNENSPTVLYNNNMKGAIMSDSEFCNQIKPKFDKLLSSVTR